MFGEEVRGSKVVPEEDVGVDEMGEMGPASKVVDHDEDGHGVGEEVPHHLEDGCEGGGLEKVNLDKTTHHEGFVQEKDAEVEDCERGVGEWLERKWK